MKTMTDLPARVHHDTVHLDQFDFDAPIVRAEDDGDYYVLRPICKFLGMSSQTQIDRLKDDPLYDGSLRTFNVPTAGGVQPSVCLHKRMVGWWIAHLDPRVVARLETRFSVTIEDFRLALIHAADQLWWGSRSVALTPVRASRFEASIHLRCLACGMAHRYASDGVHTKWEMVDGR
jgi:hypothetical protein